MPVAISTGPNTPSTRAFTSAQSAAAIAFTHPRYRDRPRGANDGRVTPWLLARDQRDVQVRVGVAEIDRLRPGLVALERRLDLQLLEAVSYTHLRAHETPEHLVC